MLSYQIFYNDNLTTKRFMFYATRFESMYLFLYLFNLTDISALIKSINNYYL